MVTFSFSCFSNQWNRPEHLRLTKTATGWYLHKIDLSGHCTPDGSPFLAANLEHDQVNYPTRVGKYLEYIWHHLDAGQIDDHQTQRMLNDLGQWIATCERSAPRWFEACREHPQKRTQ